MTGFSVAIGNFSGSDTIMYAVGRPKADYVTGLVRKLILLICQQVICTDVGGQCTLVGDAPHFGIDGYNWPQTASEWMSYVAHCQAAIDQYKALSLP